MMTFTKGDILSANAEALVNTVNCVGIMGRGIALQFKNAFPANFKAYKAACDRNDVQPGQMFIFRTGSMTNPKYIINFPTKRHWRGKSRIEDIETGLKDLAAQVVRLDIRSVAIPALGSGLGGLDWPDVRALVAKELDGIGDVQISVYEPNGAPDTRSMTRSIDVPTMSPGRAALVFLMHRYLGGLLDPVVTLLEVHKLMYFMQEAGEPLRLRYRQGPYGPYAENLRHVLVALEGHLISGYADGGDSPGKRLELVPGAISEAEVFLKDNSGAHARAERVGTIVDGFESSFGLELLATVHWVVNRNPISSAADVVRSVYEWGDRKKQFSERQILIALDRLRVEGWTTVAS